eukprot:scaffold25929_cov255-Cylindrotheca_fusiformis.AAC.1
MNVNTVKRPSFQSIAKDVTTVASFHSKHSFDDDGMADDVSSRVFKSSSSVHSVPIEKSTSMSLKSGLRVNPKSSELKL